MSYKVYQGSRPCGGVCVTRDVHWGEPPVWPWWDRRYQSLEGEPLGAMVLDSENIHSRRATFVLECWGRTYGTASDWGTQVVRVVAHSFQEATELARSAMGWDTMGGHRLLAEVGLLTAGGHHERG